MVLAFQTFSSTHFEILLVCAGASTLLILLGRKHDRLASRLLATILFAIYPITALIQWDAYGVVPIETALPLHLCDFVAVLGAIGITYRRRKLCEIVYFWALAGSIQGLITPDLYEDASTAVVSAFFLHHFAIVLAALYLPLARGWRPSRYGWIRAWLWLNAYVLVAICANTLLGTNYAYLAEPPEGPSMLDMMGPHPWYLLTLQPIALLLFYVLQAPFLSTKKKTQRAIP